MQTAANGGSPPFVPLVTSGPKPTLVSTAANGGSEPKLTDAAARTNGGLPIGACTHGDIVFSAVQATAQDAEALDVREGSSFFSIDHLT